MDRIKILDEITEILIKLDNIREENKSINKKDYWHEKLLEEHLKLSIKHLECAMVKLSILNDLQG